MKLEILKNIKETVENEVHILEEKLEVKRNELKNYKELIKKEKK